LSGFSCHVYRVYKSYWASFRSILDRLVERSKVTVSLLSLGNKEFTIHFKAPKDFEGENRYYMIGYPELIEYIDYDSGKQVKKYRLDWSKISLLELDVGEFNFVLICGGNANKVKGILVEIVSKETGQEFNLHVFPVDPKDIEYIIDNYGFTIRFSKLEKTEIRNLDRTAFWGPNVLNTPIYKEMRQLSREPDKEIRLEDPSRESVGVIGITRIHDETRTMSIRVWKQIDPDRIASYLTERIIGPIIRKKTVSQP
jgi:hypothetical protein